MSFAACWIKADDVWAAAALQAQWFRFQPSEIDALEVEELLTWCRLAEEQIKAEREAR